MNDAGTTTGQLQMPLGPPTGEGLPEVLHSSPAATLVVDTTDGVVRVISPAGTGLLTRPWAEPLVRWLTDLATAPQRCTDTATLRTWTVPAGAERPAEAQAVTAVSVSCLPIRFRARECVMFILHELVSAPSAPIPDATCAAFTLDVHGRVDSWSPAATRITGYSSQDVIGSDMSVFFSSTSRAAGEPHQGLTRAYRTGDHRTQGWRLRADNAPIWAEVTTVALRDSQHRLAGFGVLIRDLTARHRLRAGLVSSRIAGRPRSSRQLPSQRRGSVTPSGAGRPTPRSRSNRP